MFHVGVQKKVRDACWGTLFLCRFDFVFTVLVSLWGWVLPKLSHPIRFCASFCFFYFGCFPVAVGMGGVRLLSVSQHGAMLMWMG
jgi:hypothetical protein